MMRPQVTDRVPELEPVGLAALEVSAASETVPVEHTGPGHSVLEMERIMSSILRAVTETISSEICLAICLEEKEEPAAERALVMLDSAVRQGILEARASEVPPVSTVRRDLAVPASMDLAAETDFLTAATI